MAVDGARAPAGAPGAPGRASAGASAGASAEPERIRAVPVRRPGRWVSAAVVAVLAAMVVHGLVTNPAFAWPTVAEYLFHPNVLRGVGWTLWLTVGSMAIAVVLAVLLAIMRRSENPVMRGVSWTYIWVFRGTPIYTQLVFWGLLSVLYRQISLGVPFGPSFVSFDTQDLVTASRAALLGLALNEAAYLAEIVRAGLQSVDPGQSEAARALGMKEGRILRRIVLPQAMRVIVPPTGNETISMLKTTSLVLAVPFTLDLNFATNAIANRTFQPVPLLLVAAIWYLAITSVLMVGQSRIERYYGRGFDSHRPARGRQGAINAAGTTPEPGPNDDMGRPAGGGV
ncbi:amino acid ABC transporter permease [Cellulomonas marina]|uniref:Polar amino acid transport system permease protein n=1 Tax=Cellulomonas marina TaxID=988821 RepID=A0A1I0W6C8_9CELL|nr:amino acid ABC transporter permease [Cellulomonas marina]GIG29984.1 ABC transporter permease [Cellulomonas marina]SFA83466.1 polar amino acid transport system permease protein [Cellulomonas marina]